MLEADPKNLYKDYGAVKPSQGDQQAEAQPASRLSEEKTIVLPERIQGLKVHPAAELLPTMTPDEFKALKEDIDVNDLRDNIILIHDEHGEALILEGRHRAYALELLEKPLEGFCDYYNPKINGSSPELFVLSRNLHRRHLTAGQKAALALKILAASEMRSPGNPQFSCAQDNFKAPAKIVIAEAAKAAGSTPESVKALRAIEHKAPEIAAKIKAGTKSIRQGQREAKVKVDGIELDRAMERIKKVCGADFYDSVCSGELKLKPEEVVGLAERSNEVMKKFMPLLKAGWSLRRALNLENSEITFESRFRVQAMLEIAAYGGLPN